MIRHVSDNKQGSGTSLAAQKNWTCPDRTGVLQGRAASNAQFGDTQNPPYAVPGTMDEKLLQLRDFWNSLKRGNADIPFADDVQLGSLRNPSGIMLLQVFEKPERFRFDVVGREVTRAHGSELANKFADEIRTDGPLDYFLSQCSATITAHAPTFYRHVPTEPDRGSYQRLLLPLWANGHIAGLLGAVSKQ